MERDLPDRGPGEGHRRRLRRRTELWRPESLALRRAHRQRRGPLPALHRVPHRSRSDGHRRARRCALRRRCRKKRSLEDIVQPLSSTRLSSHLSAVTGASVYGRTWEITRRLRRSVGSHENPTDSDFDVTGRFPGRDGWPPISPDRWPNRTYSSGPQNPAGRNG
jgi:hypothetical protein